MPIDGERWANVSRLLEAALEQPANERDAFLTDACAGDHTLRHEIDSLLAQEQRTGLLDRPVYVTDDLMPQDSALSAGTTVGPYHVEGIIGAGGMGEVYRARDTRLGRWVALKVLPPPFASNPERMARFQREAQTLATLNHPHIGAIYGIEEAGDVRALVLELVDGDTLADRIARAPIPLDEAIPIAGQIAEALEAAHERGIIHRDLKPSNIKVSTDGIAKVLDFGLARLTQQDGVAPADATISPTIASPAIVTGAGMILGTAAYMSPELAKGRPADTRSDIWAFGCVLFEMLTARRTFPGEDVAETLAAVLRAEPDLDALPVETPPPIKSLLRKTLAKNPRERLQHIGDARFDLRDAGDKPAIAHQPQPVSRERLAWAVASITALALVVIAILAYRGSRTSDTRETHVELMTAPTSDPASFALSPDGRAVAYVADRDGVSSLWVRSLDSSSARSLPNTQGAENPFWSPDGRSIGFFADQSLKRIDIETGTVQSLVRTSGRNLGGTWTADNVILYVPTDGAPIMRIGASGGASTPVTTSSPRQNWPADRPVLVAFPHVLPDGHHFVSFGVERSGRAGAYIGALDRSELKRLVDSDSAPLALSNQLLFVRAGILLAQALDPARLAVSGAPRKIADRVFVNSRGKTAVEIDSVGSLLYRGDVAEERRQLTWVNRNGRVVRTVGEPLAMTARSNPALSPDDARVAFGSFGRSGSAERDIWVLDVARGIPNRLTDDPSDNTMPVWLPDNQSIVFSRNASQIIRKSALSLSAAEETIARTDIIVGVPEDRVGTVSDVSSDGRFLLARLANPQTGYDILARDLREGGPSFSVVETPFDERDGQFAPNGRWIAYQSNKTGRFEIYLQPFRDARNTDIRVSMDGGAQVRWRRDGKELFYLALDGTLMAVPIEFGPGGETVKPGVAIPLFRTNVGGAVPEGVARHQYMVSSDGQRFLMNAIVAPPAPSPLTLILNWSPRGR